MQFQSNTRNCYIRSFSNNAAEANFPSQFCSAKCDIARYFSYLFASVVIKRWTRFQSMGNKGKLKYFEATQTHAIVPVFNLKLRSRRPVKLETVAKFLLMEISGSFEFSPFAYTCSSIHV